MLMRVSWSYLLPTPITLLSPSHSSFPLPNSPFSTLKPYTVCVMQWVPLELFTGSWAPEWLHYCSKHVLPHQMWTSHKSSQRGEVLWTPVLFMTSQQLRSVPAPMLGSQCSTPLTPPFPETLTSGSLFLLPCSLILKVWCRCSIYSWTFS